MMSPPTSDHELGSKRAVLRMAWPIGISMVSYALKSFVDYAKINYLMLMMVDPHVHFHVIPRYEGKREFEGLQFPDAGWPKLPDLGTAVTLDDDRVAALTAALKPLFA